MQNNLPNSEPYACTPPLEYPTGRRKRDDVMMIATCTIVSSRQPAGYYHSFSHMLILSHIDTHSLTPSQGECPCGLQGLTE